jgi:hypothetical protein
MNLVSRPDSSPEKEPKRQHQERAQAILAQLDPDACKALFHAFTGRPDSKTSIFTRDVVIQPDSIANLHDRVIEKLRNHQIDGVGMQITLLAEHKNAIDFSDISDFASYNWARGDRTKQVLMKWDFIVRIPNYPVPQRHTLTVKISPSFSPMQMMRVVFSHDPSDLDVAEIEAGICIARVDFINSILADELMSLVDGWNVGLPQHPRPKDWFSRLEKYDRWISQFVHYSVPIALLIASTAFFAFYWLGPSSSAQFTIGNLRHFVIWLTCTATTVFMAGKMGRWLASKCYEAVNFYGTYSVFMLTQGDKNKDAEIQARNRRCIWTFGWCTFWAILLNVIAGIITWWMLPVNP